MSKILVTGASGQIGWKTLQHLLKRRPASELVALARDPAKSAELASQGIEVRQADYSDYGSLLRSFGDVEKLMLVSTHAFADRNTEHANVINAAREAGVKHVVYMPIIRKKGSDFVLQQVTEPDIFTEEMLAGSGLTYTIASHPPFVESFQFFVGGKALDVGVRVPAGTGKAAPASREDLAEAHAVILTSERHENKRYSLNGAPAVSFADFAQILSDVQGETVPYVTVSDEQYVANRVAEGLPQVAAEFALGWVRGVNSGEWGNQTGDLERLLGRKAMTTAEFIRGSVPQHQS